MSDARGTVQRPGAGGVADDLIAGRQRRFWSEFGHQTRALVTGFANRLQAADADVVMFTARKSACFGDCLRLVQAWTPHSAICSDRVLDTDTGWLEGKRVVLVDDVIGTGVTADRLLGRLSAMPLASLSFLPMATRPEWPAALDALSRRHPDVPMHRPPVAALGTSSLGEEIVRAIASVPRPYNLDWPLLAGWSATARELDSVVVNSGWNARPMTSASQARAGVRVVTLEPKSRELSSLLPWLAAAGSTVGLLKIRIYAEPAAEGRLSVSVMPIVAFDSLAARDATALLAAAGISEAVWTGCGPTGRARLAQYGASLALGRDFEGRARALSTLSSLGESAWQRSLGFGPLFAVSAPSGPAPGHPQAAAADRPRFVRERARTPRQAADTAVEARFARSVLSAFLWEQSRSGEHRRARHAAEGVSGAGMVEFLERDWSPPSFSSGDLTKVLEEQGLEESAASLVSGFLDEAIDNGLTVPVLAARPDRVDRAYRAGESIDFAMRGQRLFYVLLDELLARTPDAVVGKILLEKILVLAIRFGVQRPPLLKESYFPTATSLLTVAYSRYGSIATLDPQALELPIASAATHTLGKELADLGVIGWRSHRRGSRVEAAVKLGKNDLAPAPDADEAPFRRIGAVVAELLDRRLVTRGDFELFVVLCNGDQVPLALGAELDRIVPALDRLERLLRDQPRLSASMQRMLAASTGDNDWYLSLLSAMDKIARLDSDVVGRVDAQARAGLAGDALVNWRELAGTVQSPMSEHAAELVAPLAKPCATPPRSSRRTSTRTSQPCRRR